MTKKTSFLKNISTYSLSTIIGGVLVLVQGIALRKILAIEEYGIYHVLIVILGYLSYVHLGLAFAAEREIPFWIGKGDSNKVREIEENVFSATLLLTLIIVTVLFGLSVLLNNYASAVFLDGFRLVLIILVFQQLIIFYETLARGHSNFLFISKRILLTSFLNFLFSILFAITWGLKGTFYGVMLSSIIGALIYHLNSKKIRWRVSWNNTSQLILTGIMLLAIGLLFILLTTIDSLFVYWILGAKFAGIYSLAPLIMSISILLPRIISAISYPEILHSYGTYQNKFLISKLIEERLKLLSVLSSLIIVILYIFIDPFTKKFLPQYGLGIAPAKIVLMFSFFAGFSFLPGYFFIAINAYNTYILVSLLSVFVVIISNVTIALYKPSLELFSIAIGSVYSMYAFLLYYFMKRAVLVELISSVRDFTKITASYLFALFCIVIYENIESFWNLDNGETLQSSFVLAIIFLFMFIPFLFSIKPIIQGSNILKSS